MRINLAVIPYFGEKVAVACDRKCHLAWGRNLRPMHSTADESQGVCYLADDEMLSDAPSDPGTYEGFDTKPEHPDEFPNKWCVRECERCVLVSHDETSATLPPFPTKKETA